MLTRECNGSYHICLIIDDDFMGMDQVAEDQLGDD